MEKHKLKLADLFNNQELLRKALTHKSFGSAHNERLEFLGDAVLEFCCASFLYAKFSNLTEGELSVIKANTVNKHVLAKWFYELNLETELLIQKKIEISAKIASSTVEAIIGALYLDGGIQSAQKFIQPWLDSIALQKNTNQKSAKTRLQELLHKKASEALYELDKTIGKDHDMTFYVSCKYLNKTTKGIGKTIKAAQEQAASNMLTFLQYDNS